MKMEWPKDQEFDDAGESLTPVMAWGDLEQSVYLIERCTPVTTKYGPRQILQLRNEMGERIRVWGLERVIKDLGDRWVDLDAMPRIFIRINGLKPMTRDPSKSYHSYDLVSK